MRKRSKEDLQMLKADCPELGKDFISIRAPENHEELLFFCPHCKYRVKLVTVQEGERSFSYWKHVIYNHDCPIMRKERGEQEYPPKKK